MNECGTIATNNNDEPQAEVIGDETKAIFFDTAHITIKRVCILSIHPNYTIEAAYGDSSTISTTEEKQQHTVIHPHDTEEVLKQLDPNINVQTIYLVPNVRQSIAAIRRIEHEVDIFINLYDNSDDTATKVIEYMQNQGIAFTGAGLHFCDPTRIELKRLCQYSQLPTPKFAFLTGSNNQYNNVLKQLPEKLGGFPLFIKPEHGYDSKLFLFECLMKVDIEKE
ncbi:unnamed protein product [Didymodactylos carnosus]|uniref:Uncharacterized protein n=1 Tax=Didymodactylos carnosus TaxID=1234261 RepID=A0A814WN30_9BILA|nr:unnamed protein product [Didymodactylos carnosus]CAF1204466.1 unnamed protein product [Didymodactylos carnosus]CAF3575660.1 unnamed protein product [Didymodactylos carnosus]CAF3968793.1 unnamed protein product [Didymodactylos carnosus]